MAQKDVTINDILNGGKGSPGNGGTTATGTTRGTDTTSSQPPATGGGSTATPPVDGAQGVVDFGNSASAQPKKPVTTAEATDPTQAAINLVEQQQAQQAPTPASTGNFTPNVQTTTHSSTASTTGNTTTSTTGNTTTTPTGSNGDVGKDKDAAAVDTEPQDSKKKSAMSYADMFAAMEPYKEPTKEELEKERKKEKRERLFAAIGDGISALSNLFFTTQYAPNMYDPNKETNSERVENYWTNLKKEREANRQRYVDGYIKAKQADDLHAIQQQNADAAAEWKKADTERKNAIAKAQGEVLAARAAKDQSAADLAAKKLEYLIAGWPEEQAKKQAEIDLLKAKKKQADAQTNNANASADEHRRRGTASWVGGSSDKGGNSGGKGGKPYATLNGVPYASKADYERAVVSYAKQYGIPLQYKKKGGVGGMTETTTNRTIASLASDVEALYRKTHAKSKPNAPSKPAKKGGGAKGGNWASGLKL
jgi:hypothetical protein|nr:MAG TPA: hypothetical protein [Caudoviricetes sp.]